MVENNQVVTYAGVTASKTSCDNLNNRFLGVLLERMVKPISFEEVSEIYKEELPKLAETDEEKRMAHVLANIGYHKNNTFAFLVENDDKISSSPGIVDDKPMRTYSRKS